MPLRAGTSAGTPRALTWALSLYAICSLISMAVMSIGAVILMLTLLISTGGPSGLWSRIREEWRQPISKRYIQVSLGLFFALAASIIAALIWPLSYAGVPVDVSLPGDFAKSWYLFWPFLLVIVLRRLTTDDRSLVLRAWLIAFGALSIIGFFQYYTGWPRMQPIPGHDGRFHATLFLGHHLSVASVLIFPFFCAVDLSEKAMGPKLARLPRGVLVAFAILGAVTLFLGYSRTLWVALPLGMIVWVLWVLPRKISLVSITALVLAGGIALQAETVRNRVSAAMGIQPRIELWKANLQFVRDRPLTGAGWNQNLDLTAAYFMEKFGAEGQFVSHAHNNMLEVLAGTGVLGFLAWLLWNAFLLSCVFKAARGRFPIGFSRGLFCALIVFHLNGLTQVNFWESKVLHQLCFMTAWALFWMSGTDRSEPSATQPIRSSESIG